MASEPIVKEMYIDAPPSIVFKFLTDPKKMIRWMGIRAEIDPRPGGIYRVEPKWPRRHSGRISRSRGRLTGGLHLGL